jgi:hypothetical protein
VILTALMAHPRKLVRKAVVAMLTNATAALARVSDTRIEPHKKAQLPAISVYTLHDPVDVEASKAAPRERKHDLELEVAIWVAHSETSPAVDQIDDIAEQVEAVLEGDQYLQGTASESSLTGTEIQIVEDPERNDPTVGIATLTYSVTYRKSPAAPGLPDDFKTVDAKYQLVGGVADTVPAEDTFTVQETP